MVVGVLGSGYAQADTAEAVSLPAVKVTATGVDDQVLYPDVGYQPMGSAVGSRNELPLKDIPQSVSVVNDELLQDMAPRVIDEVADYIAGVEREGVQANPYAISFFVRGFNTAGGASSYNGFRDQGFNTPQSMINIERIEFLKGPSSVLYGGSSALSGLVNIVSKKPLAESYNRLETTVGSFDHLATSLDSGGAMNADKSLRYRLTAEVDKDGNFIDDMQQQSVFVSPYFSWLISDDTQLDIELVNQHIDRPGRESGFRRHPIFFTLPENINLGDPRVPLGAGGQLDRHLGRVELTHRFANQLKLRQAVLANNVHSDDSTIQVIGYSVDAQTVSRRVRAVDEYQRERYSQTELSGEGVLMGLQHQWLTGVELGRVQSGYAFLTAAYTDLNIFNPQYPGEPLAALSSPFPPSVSEAENKALYVQDLVTLGAGFKVMAGGRYDRVDSISRTLDGQTADSEQQDSAFSPRLGLIYQPTDITTYYTSWSRSFNPNMGIAADGSHFDPEEGQQYEVGIKQQVTPRTSVNAAVFEYQRENVLTTDINDENFSATVGEQRSRGFELEAIGQVTDSWSMMASYGFLDAEITADNDLPVGDRLTGVPRHSVGVFNKVNLATLGLNQWSVTAGVAYAAERESGLPNDPDADGAFTHRDVQLPAYTKVDAGIVYDADAYQLRLNGRNLTDEKIYDGYFSTFQPRAGRSVDVSMAIEF
jgi:iron complex outermembrane receptor protein